MFPILLPREYMTNYLSTKDKTLQKDYGNLGMFSDRRSVAGHTLELREGSW